MSRTYRKNSYFGTEISKESYIQKQLEYRHLKVKSIRRRLKGDEAEQAKKEYLIYKSKAIEEARNTLNFYKRYEKYNSNYTTSIILYEKHIDKLINTYNNIPKYFYVRELKDVSKDEVIKDATKYYNSFFRDGVGSETSRRTGFKKQAARIVRRANRCLEKNIVKGNDDWNNYAYPNHHDGDFCSWNWW